MATASTTPGVDVRGLLASPLGFVIGLSLGALGSGGSILAVPVLVYVAGESPQAATTTSLVVVGLASLVGMGDHWRAGRVRVGVGIVFGAAGIGGSIAGSALNRQVDGDVLLLAFSALILLAAWRMLTACPTCTRAGEAREAGRDGVVTITHLRADPMTALKVVVAGTLVGFFTGLFGVGGGFIIIPALTLLLGFAMPEAIGTSLLIIAFNTVTALAARAGSGIEWDVTLPFALAALVGVLTGTRLADRLPADRMLRWFAALLVTVAVYTAVRSLGSLV